MDIADPALHDKPLVEPAERPSCPPESRRFVLLAAILASGMGFIDGSVVSLALPAIRADLGASLIDAQWIHNSYLLLLSALVLIGGAAGDVFGVRRVFASGIAIFVVTSLACALAPDANTLIAMRAAQGFGAALMVPGSLALIAKSFPPATRGAAIGTWAAFSSITAGLGPFIGGMLLTFGDEWMWRLIFAINGPIGVFALYLLLRKVPADRPVSRRGLDIPGALLATLSLGLVSWGLTAFGVKEGSRLVSPWLWLAGGIVAGAGFIVWERTTPSPMVKLELFGSAAFSGANLYTLILFFAFNAVLFFMPMTVIAGWGAKEWEASVLSLPIAVFIATLSGFAGRRADRVGPRGILTAGAVVCAVAFAGLGITIPLERMWTVSFPFLALMGLGMGLLVSPLSTAVMLAAPDDDAGFASGVNNAVARAAGLIAVALLGAAAGIVYARTAPGLDVGFGALPTAALSPDQEGLRIAATNLAFQVVSYVSAAACVFAAVIAWFTQPAWRTGEKPAVS